MKLTILSVITLLSAAALFGQTSTPMPTSQPSALMAAIGDTENISLVTYALAQIADSTTDWNFTLAGKHYNVKPAQRAAFAGGTVFGAIAVSHYFPKAKPYVTAGLVVGTAILAGRAYGHTLARTSAPGDVAAAATSKIAFAVRIR